MTPLSPPTEMYYLLSKYSARAFQYRCLLIKICRLYRIVFTFHENLSDEKLPEMKRTVLFF